MIHLVSSKKKKKNFWSAKTVKWPKNQVADPEKVPVNCMFDKTLVSRIYKSQNLIDKKNRKRVYRCAYMPRTWMCFYVRHMKRFSTSQMIQFNSVQSLSYVRLFATPWIAARQASLFITNSRSSLRLMSIESVMPSSHLILCSPLLLLPPIPPIIRVFSNESALHMRWLMYWSFSFSIIPSKEIPGLISFRIDWLDVLAVQGTLKSLLQHHSSKASILQRSAFITVQLSHP